MPYLPGESANAEVDRSLQRRESMIKIIKSHLIKAQERMKKQADKHRAERQFAANDWVWLKLQGYRQQSVQARSNNKLSPKYYGPFQILAPVGTVAYKLKLPAGSHIHNVFHVSQLKRFQGHLPAAAHIPSWLQGTSQDVLQPEAILDTKLLQISNLDVLHYLVQWTGCPEFEATWVPAPEFVSQFPSFPIPS